MKNRLFTLVMLAGLWLAGMAQVTSSPSPLQEDSQNVQIFFHADQGNKGLMGQPASAAIYAHTGVITSASTGPSDWKYAPTWGDNNAKYKLEYVEPNVWKLNIGDMRTYYGITNPNEEIKKLAFVFRNANSSLEGKGEGNSDIFLDVVDAGLQIALEATPSVEIITASTNKVTFKAGSTTSATLTLTVNGTEIAKADNATTLTKEYTFSSKGNYTVVATATKGSDKVTATRSFCYASDSKSAPYPGGAPVMGTVRDASGKVTFCIAAPQKSHAMLVGSWNDYAITDDQTMNYTDVDGFRYFWVTVDGLAADARYPYYYIIDRTIKVGDPYAKLVLDTYDGYISPSVFPDLPAYPVEKVSGVPLAIYQENINDYKWRVKDFKGVAPSDLVIYELLVRDFTGTEGKAEGNGNINGVAGHIHYLKRLGVNAIELLPINEFNGNISWGYNPNFYFAPDKAYGTPDDYKNLIDLCHEYGMAVIVDVVLNQSDWLHPWYQMYPVGENPFYNASAPHAYSVLNDWNQGYPLVDRQWKDMLQYWLREYNVDGFRFDLVKGLGDNDSYANSGDASTNAYNASRVARMKKLQEYVREVKPDAYFINENLAGAKEENEMAATGQLNWLNLNNAGCQFAMGYSSDSGLNGMYAPNTGRDWGSTVSYLESHDEQRLAYKQEQWGAFAVKNDPSIALKRLGSAAAQMIMAPGAHMIWQFSELGNAQNTKDDNGGNNTDPKIVNWGLYDDPVHRGLYESYSELIAVRTRNTSLFTEQATFTMACNTSDWANGRKLVSTADGKEIVTVINPNLTGDLTVKHTFAKQSNSAYQILSKSYDSAPSFDAAAGTVTVPANCYVVIASEGVASVDGPAAEDASTFEATGGDGVIRISGDGGRYVVVDAAGRIIASGDTDVDSEVSVAPGFYIVTDGERSIKIVI